MGIGSKINDLMAEKNMNANELSKRVGVAPTTIYSMIQRDSKKADIEVLIRIASVLGVPVEYFSDDYEKSQFKTIAAHFEGTTFSEVELEDISNYIEFVKSKKN